MRAPFQEKISSAVRFPSGRRQQGGKQNTTLSQSMKKLTSFLALLGFALAVSPTGAATNKDGLPGSGESPLEKLIREYPLETCVVSGDGLGDMGPPVDYIHAEAGKPDRLVRLCCKGCLRDFKKEPERYLAVIDEAAKQRAAATAGTRR
jgi:hypothetical protein